jgi:hypothetical protein
MGEGAFLELELDRRRLAERLRSMYLSEAKQVLGEDDIIVGAAFVVLFFHSPYATLTSTCCRGEFVVMRSFN